MTGMGTNLKKAKGHSEERFHILPSKILVMTLGLGKFGSSGRKSGTYSSLVCVGLFGFILIDVP